MNTINELFSNYGWKEYDNKQYDNKQYDNPIITKKIYKKINDLNEFIIEERIDNTYTISVPLLNSNYLYKHTINNIQDAITYIQMHLENLHH